MGAENLITGRTGWSRRSLAPVRTRRLVVDYALQRRALLREVYSGRVGTSEVCDASPYLVSAAKYHGEMSDVHCPVCRRENLWHVNYIYGDELRSSAGQARASAELATLATIHDAFDVYVVEVCRGCFWNHLVVKFTLGHDGLGTSDEESTRATVRRAGRDG
ncbi:DUF5318 family protein [Fodinicola feengrottensis]|uniref:DUF5318 family protein n=1 Tax=Fodinicola feengrottensis TaxID=435914 RepID=A0ABN2GWW2_9ACTN|nr:DUF5318 family protein [Fodinicola feengrottensis]